MVRSSGRCERTKRRACRVHTTSRRARRMSTQSVVMRRSLLPCALFVTPPRPSSSGARAENNPLYTNAYCCAVQAEDFGQVICPVRRRTALQRCSLIIQKEIEKERKNTSGDFRLLSANLRSCMTGSLLGASFIVSKAYEDVRQPPECPEENGESDFVR